MIDKFNLNLKLNFQFVFQSKYKRNISNSYKFQTRYFLETMDNYFLIKAISSFNINYKYFRIGVKNQLKRNYGHFYWFLISFTLCHYLINTFNLFFIFNEEVVAFKMFGSIGYMLGGSQIYVGIGSCIISHLRIVSCI